MTDSDMHAIQAVGQDGLLAERRGAGWVVRSHPDGIDLAAYDGEDGIDGYDVLQRYRHEEQEFAKEQRR